MFGEQCVTAENAKKVTAPNKILIVLPITHRMRKVRAVTLTPKMRQVKEY